MFDIGFSELLIIGVVALLVIGPERLPDAIRTGSAWLNRFKRGYNDIKREVQQELHNDSVMQELRKSGEQLKNEADSLGKNLHSVSASVAESRDSNDESPTAAAASAAEAPGTAAPAAEPPADNNPP
jgi:sec-independent protein translocase protein TatB